LAAGKSRRRLRRSILLMGPEAAGGVGDRRNSGTQEMLDFCAANAIVADVEVIPIQKINNAYERLLKSDVKISLFD